MRTYSPARFGLLVAPLVIIAVSLPLAFDLVGPNGFYGVRIEATRASEAAWYRGNQAGGVAGVMGGLVALAINWLTIRSSVLELTKVLVCSATVLAAALLIGGAGALAA